MDKAGALSANTATVIVNVIGSEGIGIAKAIYTVTKARFTLSGTDNVIEGQTLTITYGEGVLKSGASGTTVVIGTAVVDPLGNWLLDIINATGTQNPTDATVWTTKPTKVVVKSTSPVLGGSATAGISLK